MYYIIMPIIGLLCACLVMGCAMGLIACLVGFIFKFLGFKTGSWLYSLITIIIFVALLENIGIVMGKCFPENKKKEHTETWQQSQREQKNTKNQHGQYGNQGDNKTHDHRNTNQQQHNDKGYESGQKQQKNNGHGNKQKSGRTGSEQTIGIDRRLVWCFSVFCLPHQATEDQIRQQYRKLVKLYHPDVHASKGQEYVDIATKKLGEIHQAYAIFKDKGMV